MYIPVLKSKYYNEIRPDLLKNYYTNIMQVPVLEKIVLNIGMGNAHSNPKLLESVLEELSLISGQKAIKTIAKKSIAGFKIREGMVLGCKSTLRGNNMYEFLNRFISLVIPRIRDFSGLKLSSFDGRGSYNMSIKEQIIFPEIKVDRTQSIYGMNITFVSTSHDDDGCYNLLKSFGMPYMKKKGES